MRSASICLFAGLVLAFPAVPAVAEELALCPKFFGIDHSNPLPDLIQKDHVFGDKTVDSETAVINVAFEKAFEEDKCPAGTAYNGRMLETMLYSLECTPENAPNSAGCLADSVPFSVTMSYRFGDLGRLGYGFRASVPEPEGAEAQETFRAEWKHRMIGNLGEPAKEFTNEFGWNAQWSCLADGEPHTITVAPTPTEFVFFVMYRSPEKQHEIARNRLDRFCSPVGAGGAGGD